MSDAPGGTLFEEQATDPAAEGPLLFVTNRYNLLEFLSAGYVLPVYGIPKYYADLLELCPGRLPLVRGGVSASIAAEVSKEDPTAFPVALSIEERVAGASSVPAFGRDGTVSTGSLDDPADAFAPAGLIPLRHVRRVHFRTQEELDEHSAREYENVRAGEVELVVSPEVFAGPGLEFDDLRRFLVGLPPVSEATVELLDDIDRVNGARAMLVALCPARAESVQALGTLIAGKTPSDEVIPSWLTAVLVTDRPKSTGAEARLFAAAADVLRKHDRASAWRPLEVLAQVEERLAAPKVPKKEEAEIAKNLRPIGAILRNERDFKPFAPDAGLSAAKALLLVLLRPDPDRLCSWDAAETGADDDVMLAAGALAGLLRGHKKLSLSMRSPTLDRLLAYRAAAAAADVLPDALRPTSADTLVVEEEGTDSGGGIIRLSWGDDVVVEKVKRPPSAAERLVEADITDPSVREVALHLCRVQGWTDCVSTTILAPGGRFAVDSESRSVRIVVPGFVDVGYELHETKFRSHLTSDRLPADVEEDIGKRLET